MGHSVGCTAVHESGFRSNRDSIHHPFIEILGHLRIGDVLLEQIDAYVEVLGNPVHVGFRDSVQYDLVIIGGCHHFRDGIVRRDRILHAPQLEFQSEIPVYGQTVQPDLHAVGFLLRPEQ